jgi:rubrerythrin
MNNVWEIALNMENEGIEFYNNLAMETENLELAGVFKFLADQEEEHKKYFESIEHCIIGKYPKTEDAESKAKEVFKKIAPNFKVSEKIILAVDAYKKAITLENKAVEYYTSLLYEAESEDQRDIIKLIINEEKNHAATLELLIDFVNRPNQWLENSEFNNTEEY